MLIEMRRNSERHLQASLRTLKPPSLEIELKITPFAGEPEADRAFAEVSRIVDSLRFCGISACGCPECVLHQVRAIISQCQLASCEVSATIRLKDKNEVITVVGGVATRPAATAAAR